MDQWGYRAESITGAAVLLRWTSVSAAVLAEASMIGRWVSIRFNTHRLASNGLCMYVIIYMASVLCSSTLDAWLHYLVVNTHTHTHIVFSTNTNSLDGSNCLTDKVTMAMEQYRTRQWGKNGDNGRRRRHRRASLNTSVTLHYHGETLLLNSTWMSDSPPPPPPLR